MANNDTASSKNQTQNQDNKETVVSFVSAVFDDVNSAKIAFETLKDLRREGAFDIIAAAYMEKTEKSKMKVHEYKDWRGGQGAIAGGAVGAVVGIIGSTILLPVAVGALIGGVLAKVHDTKFSDKNLGKVAESLPPGTSALIAIVEDDDVEEVSNELADKGGKKIQSGEVPKSTVSAMEKPSKS